MFEDDVDDSTEHWDKCGRVQIILSKGKKDKKWLHYLNKQNLKLKYIMLCENIFWL